MVEAGIGDRVFTLDKHFRIYRHSRRRLVPVLIPECGGGVEEWKNGLVEWKNGVVDWWMSGLIMGVGKSHCVGRKTPASQRLRWATTRAL